MKKILLLFLCIASCSRQGSQTQHLVSTADWPVFRGDQSLTGFVDAAVPDRPALLWTYATEEAIKSSPVIAMGRVFIGSSDGKIYSLDLADGGKKWQYDTGESVEAPPLFVDSTLFVGSMDGTFHALDAWLGAQKWFFNAENRICGSANCVRRIADHRLTRRACSTWTGV